MSFRDFFRIMQSPNWIMHVEHTNTFSLSIFLKLCINYPIKSYHVKHVIMHNIRCELHAGSYDRADN